MMASALALTGLCGTAARAQSSPSRLEAIEQQLFRLKAELRALKERAAAQDRQREAKHTQSATPPATNLATPVMPQIPAGYALVPASPGSTPGSVVLARAEAPKKPTLPMGVFQIGPVSVQLGGFFCVRRRLSVTKSGGGHPVQL